MKSLILLVSFGLGLLLVLHGRSGVDDLINGHELNPLELKRSPYGEIIGMALQEPVHLLWHGGKGHEHVGAEGEECEVCGVDHSVGGEVKVVSDRPFFSRMKLKMLRKEGLIRQNNNPGGRSDLVINFEKKRAAGLMKLAYDMDPTNYGNYNAVSFFYETGGVNKEWEKMVPLAQQTIRYCEGNELDPEDALTAASAAENILIWRAKGVPDDQFDQVSEDYELFAKKVKVFERVYQRAYDEGRLSSYTQEKLDEMTGRYEIFAYSVREYKKKIVAAKLSRQD